MTGVLCSSGRKKKLDTFTITIGGGDPYGYTAGVFGNIGDGIDDAFPDATNNSRTVQYILDGSASSLLFGLSGASIPNTAATFDYIVLGTTRYRRVDATYSANDGSGNSKWTWANGATNSIGTSGSQTLEVWG